MAQTNSNELVYSCHPYASVLNPEHRESRCDYCMKFGFSEKNPESFESSIYTQQDLEDPNYPHKPLNLKKCAGCKISYYCGKNCQLNAWSYYHKIECQNIKRLGHVFIPSPSARLFLRIYLKSIRPLKNSDESGRKFEDLMDHKKEILADEKRMFQLEKIVETLKVFCGESMALPDYTEMVEIFGRMVINTFSIVNAEVTIGSGLYLEASVLDHSCKPSAVSLFSGNFLRVYKLAKHGYRPPTISYIDVWKYQEERQKELKENYYFECKCELCVDFSRNKHENNFLCTKPNCFGYISISDRICDICGQSMQDEEFEKLVKYENKINLILEEKFDINDLENCQKFFTEAKEFIHKIKLSDNYPNRHHIAFLIRFVDAAIACQELRELYNLNVLQQLVNCFSIIYDTPNPALGYMLYRLGKIEEFLFEIELARKHYYQALDQIFPFNHKSNDVFELMLRIANMEIAVQNLENIDSWSKKIYLVQAKRGTSNLSI